MELTITALARVHPGAVAALLDAAFGRDRELRTAYRIRQGVAVIDNLSFAAVSGAALVGTLQCWPVCLDDTPLTLVGPVAVCPTMQRRGVGRQLMTRLLQVAPDDPMVMIGDPEYYGRFFGFSADATGSWDVPGPVDRHRLLARNAGRLPIRGLLRPRSFALARPTA